jgi:2-amino-4-hydroxy-6-hydroxymethyldihydropteridine diphosphokinase
MPVCLLGLGSNLGDRAENLGRALKGIEAAAEVELVAVSRYHATTPIGGPKGQGEFLNAAVRVTTSLSPAALMQHLLAVEHSLGRRRERRWGQRTIDLDILLYGQDCVSESGLIIPHPRMAFRRFVLQPAAEIAAEMIHPQVGWSIGRLLQHLDTATPYVALAGLPGAGKSELATAAAARTAARAILDPTPIEPVAGEQTPRSRDWDQHAALLDRRAALLDRVGPAVEVPESISDFWFQQTRAYAEACLTGAELDAYLERHERAGHLVVPPKLLVLLEISPQQSLAWQIAPAGLRGAGIDEARLAMVGRRLDELASAKEKHPVLRLAPASSAQTTEEFSAQNLEELVAAIETMR